MNKVSLQLGHVRGPCLEISGNDKLNLNESLDSADIIRQQIKQRTPHGPIISKHVTLVPQRKIK